MKQFDADEAEVYERKIRIGVPAYDEFHAITQSLMESTIDDIARILVVGAGTGTELCVLARNHPSWTFDAVEPSEEMRRKAVETVDRLGFLDRVRFHGCGIEEFHTEARFDAATSILVSQFLPDDGRKARYFASLSSLLPPGAPLILVDLMAFPSLLNTALREAWIAWIRDCGVDADQILAMKGNIENAFFPVTEDRLSELLVSHDLTVEGRFLQVLGFCGYLVRKSKRKYP